MFGGGANRTMSVAQNGGEFSGGDRTHVGADLALDSTVGGYTLEHDASVIIRRMQSERSGKAGMHADAGDGNVLPKRGLLGAFH